MNRASLEDMLFSLFDDIYKPERSERDIRSCLVLPEGRERYAVSQDRKVTVLNHSEAARQVAALAKSEIQKLESEVANVERQLRSTPDLITRSVEGERIGTAKLSLVILLSVVALLCMSVSISVMTEYALQSASSLFARPYTALLYSTLPSFLSVAIKLYETNIVSPYARWAYATGWFTLALCGAAAWLTCSAISLAPDLGVPLAAVADAPNPRIVGMVGIGSVVLTELGVGYTILSGVGRLLVPKHGCESIANPAFEALVSRGEGLKSKIAESQYLRIRAEDYLVRLAAVRDVTRSEADFDLARAEELFMQAQTAGLAFGLAIFFKFGEDES